MKKHQYKIVLSIVFVLISYAFILYKITDFIRVHTIQKDIFHINNSNLFLLLVVFLLMPLNWFLEAIKWRELIHPKESISYTKSFKAVLSGITIGIFTPNRVGEIGGRVLFLKKGNRSFGVITTWLGSFSQFIVTILMGLIGLIIFIAFFSNSVDTNYLFNKTSVIALCCLLFFLLWSYFNSNKINNLLYKLPYIKTKTDKFDFLALSSQKKLFKILLFSVFRYIMFSSQFYLTLLFFQVDISVLEGFVFISLIYLFTTLIPTTTLAELGIRGSVAIFIIGSYSDNIPGIIFASFCLWIINLAIPSFIGSFFLLKNRN